MWVAGLVLCVALAAARKTDHDFEFDDERLQSGGAGGGHHPRRYIHDPHSPLCAGLVCARRESCLLRDARHAVCANKHDVLRNGDKIVSLWTGSRAGSRHAGGAGGAGAGGAGGDDDVFYDTGADATPDTPRCVGCGSGGAAGFVCGSDNRTYSSLCRLDLHNCVRRASVAAACQGFCPCERRDSANDAQVPARRRGGWRGAGRCSLDKMADRLLDWFSVLMEQAGATPPPPDGFPAECQPEVRWMFTHLDTDGDGVLSPRNLYALRHDGREQCLRPFVRGCARGGAGGAGTVSRAGWCGCLWAARRPCAALAAARPPVPGAYVPACDERGFYRARQCHPALGVCWCVSPHGVEAPASRTKGAPLCPEEAEAEAGAPADDEDALAGSGDNELRF